MADVSIAWRLIDEAGSEGRESGRIGDILVITTADHVWNSNERTIYGIAIVTDIPADKIDSLQLKMQDGIRKITYVKDNGDGTVMAVIRKHEFWWPNQYQISLAKCIAQWPELEDDLTNKLFNPAFTVPQAAIPSLTWTKLKKVFYDRVNADYVADLET